MEIAAAVSELKMNPFWRWLTADEVVEIDSRLCSCEVWPLRSRGADGLGTLAEVEYGSFPIKGDGAGTEPCSLVVWSGGKTVVSGGNTSATGTFRLPSSIAGCRLSIDGSLLYANASKTLSTPCTTTSSSTYMSGSMISALSIWETVVEFLWETTTEMPSSIVLSLVPSLTADSSANSKRRVTMWKLKRANPELPENWAPARDLSLGANKVIPGRMIATGSDSITPATAPYCEACCRPWTTLATRGDWSGVTTALALCIGAGAGILALLCLFISAGLPWTREFLTPRGTSEEEREFEFQLLCRFRVLCAAGRASGDVLWWWWTAAGDDEAEGATAAPFLCCTRW